MMSFSLTSQSAADQHLAKLKAAVDFRLDHCDESEDFSFSNCKFIDKDTIHYKFENVPPVHDSIDVLIQLDKIYKNFSKEHLRKTLLRVRSFEQADIIIRFEYIDGLHGVLARADFPSCITKPQYIIFDNYDLPPGRNTPDSIKILYPKLKKIRLIAEHEGGHIAGIKHINRPTSLMKEHYDETLSGFDDLDRMSFTLLFDKNRFTTIRKTKKKITKNFTQKELFTKCRGVKYHYLHNDIIIVLQKIRDYYNSPIKITSSYRSPNCNKDAGGASKSKHLTGRAVDFKFTDPDVQEKFTKDLQQKSGVFYLLQFNGVNGIGIYNSHTHIDVRDKLTVWDHTNDMIKEGECLH